MFQVRKESGEIREFDQLAEAWKAFMAREAIKLSFNVGVDRYRLVKEGYDGRVLVTKAKDGNYVPVDGL